MNYEHHPSPPPRELTDEPREGTLNSVLKIDIDANKESDGQPLYEEASSSGNMSAMSGYVDNVCTSSCIATRISLISLSFPSSSSSS
tara:strand:+ start:6867 stop:7127 length:261 start_codon:yes stop_codon:yes gene_type:complete